MEEEATHDLAVLLQEARGSTTTWALMRLELTRSLNLGVVWCSLLGLKSLNSLRAQARWCRQLWGNQVLQLAPWTWGLTGWKWFPFYWNLTNYNKSGAGVKACYLPCLLQPLESQGSGKTYNAQGLPPSARWQICIMFCFGDPSQTK